MTGIRATRQGIADDAALKASLIARLNELDVAGPRRQIDLPMFEGEDIATLRSRVAAFEQQRAQFIVANYKRTPKNREAFMRALMDVAKLAGEPLRRHFNARAGAAHVNGMGAAFPQDEAHSDARGILAAGLRAITPKLPVVSDAPVHDMVPRHTHRWWLINAFSGVDADDASLGIALIDHGRPIAGIVHLPRLNRTYAGIAHAPHWCDLHTAKRARAISVKARDPRKQVAATIYGDRKSSAFRAARNTHGISRNFTDTGASYGLCRLAQGSFDLYLHNRPLPQSELAPAHAILLAAGGVIHERATGAEIRYAIPHETTRSAPAFIAASGPEILRMRDVRRLVA
ncbi:MAG: hypothetical protein H6865_05570 [Rhodospirillales bacterium]|nr:hypothetical protein [Alphaproteobacteria bacterium]MCB9987089.1 hypothetical protein [Rhodospirillales bacterium]USO08149.1 MAG: hypothetical protein H6866_02725 [Rhodospirillales bacterium]